MLVRSVFFMPLFTLLTEQAANAQGRVFPSFDQRRVIVKFADGAGPENPIGEAALLAAGPNRTERLQYLNNTHVLHVDFADGPEVRDLLVNWPGVEYAEFDGIGQLMSPPNDPGWCDQWALENRGQAFQGTPGTPGKDICASTAYGVRFEAIGEKVAVLDSGALWYHSDLQQNIWTNPFELPGNNLDDDQNGYVDDIHGIGVEPDPILPFVCADPTNWHPYAKGDPNDIIPQCMCYPPSALESGGHGTRVTATLGAVGDNGQGITGVAWRATIIPIRVTSCDAFVSITAVGAAFDYAHQQGVRIINCSWSFANDSQTLKAIFKQAKEDGIIITVAAGNEPCNLDVGGPGCNRYPQVYDYDNMIVVMAINHTGQRASFSSWGPVSVDVAAPGENIRVLDDNSTQPPSPTYVGGTSFAAPIVAAEAALVWAQNPGWTYDQVIKQILDTATVDPLLSGLCVKGARVNLAGALGVGCPTCRPAACNGTCP